MNPLDRAVVVAVLWVALGFVVWAVWHQPPPTIAGAFPYVKPNGEHVLVVTGEHFTFGLTPRVVPHGQIMEMRDRHPETMPIPLECFYFSPTFLEVRVPATLRRGDYDLGLFQDAHKLTVHPHVPVW